MKKETWDVKIVPQLNHDLYSFTKATKGGWQMNERWKEGGLIIVRELDLAMCLPIFEW